MRGSPIRTSSDQRSVDSSPRLIAASYVLHRLLVPRHPPCALKNLATQKSHPSTPGRTSMSGPTQTLYYRVRRCSRPLCSSQRTTRHRPRSTARPARPHGDGGGTTDDRPRHELTTPPGFPGRPAPSGPNSVPTTGSPPPPRSPPAPEGTGRTSGDDSCRPNWSAFHPRAPPQMRAARRD